ncbi:MAG TPA: hypothetical protein VF649_06695 [Sphingomonas sp.]
MAYMHGIQVIEIGGSATIVAPIDGVAPIITSPLTATTRENTAWSMTLLANENVSFVKRTAADSAAFTLAGATLSLPAQDYEGGQTAFVCNLVAMDTAGNVTNFAVTVTVTDVDEIAPLITSAPTATIAAATGYAVTLTANEAVSFEKRTGADGDLFGLAGTTLTLPAQTYNAGKVTFTVNLRALDGAGNATLFTHVVTVAAPAPVVDTRPPVITSALTATVVENTGWAITLTADEAVTFSKRTGADSASFTLAGATLSLPAQDYEGGKTAFVCNLTATDAAGNATNFAVTVNVTDLDEIAPLVTSAATATVAASTAYSVTLAANEAVTFEKRTGADTDLFGLAGTTLTLPAQAYNAGKPTFTANLRAIDAAGNATLFTHVVTIATPAVTPTLVITGPLAFTAGAPAGTLVFNIAGVPAGVTPTITPADGRVVVAGDATNGWKGVIGLTVSTAGTTDYAVAAAGATGATARVVVTAAAARMAIASTGLNWPMELDAYGVVPDSATATNGTKREFSQSTTLLNHPRACTGGWLLGGNRYFSGSTNGDAMSTTGTSQNTYHRVDILDPATSTVYPVLHPANGQPIAAGNPFVFEAGAIFAFRHGALPAADLHLRVWDQVPIGGRRLNHRNRLIASKISDVAFHTGTGSPAAVGSISAYPVCGMWSQVDDSSGPSVVVAGDSIEHYGRVVNGRSSEGPLRHLLTDPSNGGAVPVVGNVRYGAGPGAFFGPNTNGRDALSTWEEFGVLVGQTDRWLFRQVVLQHWRNGVTNFIANAKTGIGRLRAKDPNIQVFGVTPDFYVQGPSSVPAGPVPTGSYATVTDQVLMEPNGTTDRQAVIAWYRGSAGV